MGLVLHLICRKWGLVALFFCGLPLLASAQLRGRVIDEQDGKILVGAVVRVKGSDIVRQSDSAGRFSIPAGAVAPSGRLVVSLTGYVSAEFDYAVSLDNIVRLKVDVQVLDQVMVSTGYQKISRERATGSFVKVDELLLNRSSTTDLLSRLEGTVPGLVFDRRGIEPELDRGTTKVRIRGESSINAASEPLVVVDNFPYEGDLSNIDPNDIESVTVLKDAAAASIWGARAGNGVIVVTTKKANIVPR